MLVSDASALVDLLLARPSMPATARYLEEHEYAVHAPYLVDIEVLSALRRLTASGVTSALRASEALEDFLDLPLQRHQHAALAPRIWALRETMSAHDAAYVALAEALSDEGVPLLTADARLGRAVEARTGVTAIVV